MWTEATEAELQLLLLRSTAVNGEQQKGDQERWVVVQDLHPEQPEYKAGFLLTGLQCSIY
jgi:hypothetical protein